LSPTTPPPAPLHQPQFARRAMGGGGLITPRDGGEGPTDGGDAGAGIHQARAGRDAVRAVAAGLRSRRRGCPHARA
jgi:hypothetical protein